MSGSRPVGPSRDAWSRLEEIFREAVTRSGEEREAYLDEVCDEAGLKREVLELIAAEERIGSFLENPPVEELKPSRDSDAKGIDSMVGCRFIFRISFPSESVGKLSAPSVTP